MRFSQLSYLAALAGSQLAAGEGEAHGEGYEGTVMGPVAFLWPDDRPWSPSADNIAPCGSSSGVVNRTIFPLSQGSVALSIADDAWNVNFSIAYDNEPTIQSQFSQQVVSDITEIEPGHQCYKIADIPNTVAAGTNATIQLEYWSNVDNELGGRNQTFYACADVTFVETKDFSIQVPCFNITASDFNAPGSSSTSTPAPSATGANAEASTAPNPSTSSSSGDGLSGGAKAGIAVGVIVASLAIVAGIAFVVLRRRKSRPIDHEASAAAAAAAAKNVPEVSSVHSLRQ